jgi:hypothetical protein
MAPIGADIVGAGAKGHFNTKRNQIAIHADHLSAAPQKRQAKPPP